MKSLSSVGLGLSIIFGCLLLALVGELYYLLWWKKRFTNREIENDIYSRNNPVTDLLCMLCCKKPPSLQLQQQNLSCLNLVHEHVEAQQQNSNKDQFLFKPFGGECDDAELMRLHNLSGPPQFLFTIVEETKEDLESEDGKNSRSCLSDFLVDTPPYLTPLASPSCFNSTTTPPYLTPTNSNCNNNGRGFGFNLLFESSSDAEFNKIKSSPPPKFKFLQDAEEKLHRKRLMEEESKKDTFITVIVDNHSQQVIPLVSTFRSPPENSH